MSQQNVQFIKRLLDAFNQDPESALRLLDPEIEWDTGTLEIPGLGGTYRGLAELRRFWEAWFEVIEDYRVDVIEFIDAGDAVIVVTDTHGHGRRSGIDIERRWFTVYWIGEGRVKAVRNCTDRAEAIEAVGLPE